MNSFRRVLLKLSGESLMGAQQYGIDTDRLSDYARDIQAAVDLGIQVAIVIGGGNIFRGLSGATQGFDRVQGDQMGMLATVINSLALSSALTSLGVKNRVLTAIRGVLLQASCAGCPRGRRSSDPLGWHGESLLHDRHGLFAPWYRARSRCDAQGNTCRWYLHR